jgi:hypothetical protein
MGGLMEALGFAMTWIGAIAIGVVLGFIIAFALEKGE